MAFTVSVGRREITVRLALGAGGALIARLVLRNGLKLAAVGVATGSAAGFGVTRVLSNLLYGVEPTDPLTFAAAAASLLSATALACYLPPRQTSRLEPVEILRE